MKYPKLVRKEQCKVPIKVIIYSEDIDKDGAPVTNIEYSALCNYQSSAKRVLTEKQEVIQLSAVALFPNDFCPDLPEITAGEVVIMGEKRRIYKGAKARNPDGTVNYIKLELI